MGKILSYIKIDQIIKKQSEELDKDFDLLSINRESRIVAGMYSYYSNAKVICEIDTESELPINLPSSICFCGNVLNIEDFKVLRAAFTDAKFVFVYVSNEIWNNLSKADKKAIIAIPKKIKSNEKLIFPWENQIEPILEK